MMKWRILKTLDFMFAFLCTRLSKQGKTQSSQFGICFCFYSTLFLLCDGSMSGKLGSQHQLFGIIVWIIFSFKWYETVVRNEHLFMLIKWVFHSIHLFWLYVLVHVTAQNVHFFSDSMAPFCSLCAFGTGNCIKEEVFLLQVRKRRGKTKTLLGP